MFPCRCKIFYFGWGCNKGSDRIGSSFEPDFGNTIKSQAVGLHYNTSGLEILSI